MGRFNAGRLKLELFCRGARIDESCTLEADTRPIKRTRGGLGSGLDAILPGNVWVNIPVVEPFAQQSPFLLRKAPDGYSLWREGDCMCDIKLPPRPEWYDLRTSSGKRIGDVGVMQGTYFAIYPSDLCGFWKMTPRKNCRFCSVGLCLGQTESESKSVQDVVEAVQMARKHEKITFVHFNTGYYDDDAALDIIMPYVNAVRRATGLLVGVQCPPAIELSKYDRLKRAGADHVSLCFELFDPERFETVCPGKAQYFGAAAQSLGSEPLLNQVRTIAAQHAGGRQPHPGQLPFYRAIAYCAKLWGRGRVSGEIIAGLEKPKATIEAIEFLAQLGAVSTVCVFRPCTGTDLAHLPPPEPDVLESVFARMYDVCIERGTPFGLAPNIRTAMVHLPAEGAYFATEAKVGATYRAYTAAARVGVLALLMARCAIRKIRRMVPRCSRRREK